MPKFTVPANELALRSLRCPEDRPRVIYHLGGHGNEGLKLFVEKSGTKSWYYHGRVNGSVPKDMPLGRWPDLSIAETRSLKAEAVSQISKGEAPWQKRAEAKRRRYGITLTKVFELWVNEVGYEKRTISQDLMRYEMNLKRGYRFTRGRLNGRVHKASIGALPIAAAIFAFRASARELRP